jgi:hypothetical protein
MYSMYNRALIVVSRGHHITVFQETTIRRVWHNEEWWFAIVDEVGVLTDSVQPEGDVKDLRRRDPELAKGWGQIATPLRVQTAGGAQRVNCANTEGLFRIIQSIPSPKAEPFKRWLAQVGYERVKEIENPELASARARELYQAKGYPQAWIEKRLRSISVRGELTDEWKARGVAEGKEYSILTAEIARRSDALGFDENRTSAKEGGKIAGNARKALEAKTGKKVVSKANYLATAPSPDLLDAPKPAPSSTPRVRVKSKVPKVT